MQNRQIRFLKTNSAEKNLNNSLKITTYNLIPSEERPAKHINSIENSFYYRNYSRVGKIRNLNSRLIDISKTPPQKK